MNGRTFADALPGDFHRSIITGEMRKVREVRITRWAIDGEVVESFLLIGEDGGRLACGGPKAVLS